MSYASIAAAPDNNNNNNNNNNTSLVGLVAVGVARVAGDNLLVRLWLGPTVPL